MAAISQVLNSNAFPETTYKVNIFGTINLLESFRKYQPKTHFIFSSSDKVYGDSQKLPYSENSPLNALNFYDSSKASADIICRTYANSFKMKIIQAYDQKYIFHKFQILPYNHLLVRFLLYTSYFY